MKCARNKRTKKTKLAPYEEWQRRVTESNEGSNIEQRPVKTNKENIRDVEKQERAENKITEVWGDE